MNMRLVALLGCLAVTGAVWVWSAPSGPPVPPAVPAVNGTTRAAHAGAGTPASAMRRPAPARDRGAASRTTAPRDTPPERVAPFDLDDVEARLRERRRSAPAPRSPERNPFMFGPETSAAVSGDAGHARARAAAPPPAPPAVTAPIVPPPPVLKLSGIAETRNGDQVVRTAIIAGQGQLFFAKIGERVGPLYEVSAIGPDIVELRETGTDRLIRLTMR